LLIPILTELYKVMPLEIRELVIKVTVEESDKKIDDDKILQDYKKEIIRDCTEQIMDKLRSRTER
jgi:hypothetical protein